MIYLKLRVFGLLLLAFLFIPTAYGAVTGVTITPSNPEQGETVEIVIQGDPAEQVSMSIDYAGDVPVSAGKYLIELNNIEIPSGPNNVFARATGVENLKVAVWMGFWVTITQNANGGTATMSQSNIPGGNFNIQVKGDALSGISEVHLTFSADITITLDGSGRYTYSYKTTNIPPGVLDVDVGGITRSITLTASSGSSDGISVPLNPVANFKYTGDLLVGEVISFDAKSSKPTYGSITEYLWDFDDGTTSEGEQVTHVFTDPGEYRVSLTVTNSIRLSNEKKVTLEVNEDINLVPISDPGSDRKCFTNQKIDFSSKSTDLDGSIVRYLWDFGDGFTGVGRRVSHSWSNPGVYYVNHTVIDNSGTKDTAFLTVLVEEILVPVSNFKNVTAEGQFFQHFDDLKVSITANVNDTRFYLFGYNENPDPNVPLPDSQTGGIVDLVVTNPDQVLWPIYFELEYTNVSEVIESSLGLYYFSDGVWSRCRYTGVDMERNVVWANLTSGELVGSPLTVAMLEPLPFFVFSDLDLSEDSLEVGESLDVSFIVENTGEQAGNVVTIVYVDEEPVQVKTLHLNSGEMLPQSIRFVVEDKGISTVRVEDMEYSFSVTPITLSDLVPSVIASRSEVELGDDVVITFSVENLGNRTADEFSSLLLVDGLVVSSNIISELESDTGVSSTYIYTATKPGNVEVLYTVDSEERVSEIDDGDNTSSVVFTVKEPDDYRWVLVLLVAVLGVVMYMYRVKLPFSFP